MRYLRFLISFVSLLLGFRSSATHIRAGEIIARQVSGTEYIFTFIGYRDIEGIIFQNGVFDFGDGTTFGGDSPGEVIPWVRFAPEDGVERWEFTLPHTYPAAANYIVSYTEENRNENIQNIPGSVNTAFHVETLIIIDALFPNSSPFFTVPPIDQGVVGSTFEHNPGAFDPDDDSLSYSLVTPQQANGLDVGGYLQLNDASFYDDFGAGNSTDSGPPEIFIDPATGTLTWDAPGGATIPDMENREWNVAIRVQEWRRIGDQFIPLGYVVRDMQIIIWDFENEPPELELPENTCVVAGETITGIVTATDPDGDSVKLEAFGGPFQFPPRATFSPDPAIFQAIPASVEFEWQTICEFVRASPYQIEFKATDKPNVPGFSNPPGQSNFETWGIKVVGPAPQGLLADAMSGAMNLSWNPYECSNAQSIQIWRKVGAFEFNPACNVGIPENSGYELIQTQDINDTDFVDDNNGTGLAPGSKYCYRLVAVFPQPLGGLSVPSEEACDSLLIDLPVITNVDIISTDKVNGQIRVNWTPPYEIDAAIFPPNYTYEVLRAEGQSLAGSFTSLTPTPIGDTTFLDSGIDTDQLAYSYRIILRDGLNNLVDTSQQASSVRLNPSPEVGGIRLLWEAKVPWSNTIQKFPYHYVYRDNVLTNFMDSLVLIDSVDVTLSGFSYLDNGIEGEDELDEDTEYCYSVITQGSYANKLLPEPLLNRSQIICAQPNDTIPPCTPVSVNFTSNNNFDCEAQFICGSNVVSLENAIEWNADVVPECDDDIQFYRIYFSESTDSTTFRILEETTSSPFIHRNLTSLAFCYYVTAVDRSGNESQISEIICNDNCPQYLLPNVFTPNNDGFNDTFRPLEGDGQCPRFVNSV
ncbi:MAG: gliding motility-associated C-terminal domain-containing protein, partial [Ekhidna sp.]|nr:gliding motility-associated C-terminal domain-containing protein [Ekhidna sp.]